MRALSIAIVAVIALSCSACSSKNEGKIVGKWKMLTGPGVEEQAKELEKVSAYMFMEFKADGTLVLGAESSDPNVQKLLAASGKTTFSGKYRLKSGAVVEFYEMPPEFQAKGGMFGKSDRARTNITIDGDKMTMKDDTGSGTLVRIK